MRKNRGIYSRLGVNLQANPSVPIGSLKWSEPSGDNSKESKMCPENGRLCRYGNTWVRDVVCVVGSEPRSVEKKSYTRVVRMRWGTRKAKKRREPGMAQA